MSDVPFIANIHPKYCDYFFLPAYAHKYYLFKKMVKKMTRYPS